MVGERPMGLWRQVFWCLSQPLNRGGKMARAGLWWKWKTSWGLLKVWKGKHLWERQSLLPSWEVGDERLVLLVRKPDLDA